MKPENHSPFHVLRCIPRTIRLLYALGGRMVAGLVTVRLLSGVFPILNVRVNELLINSLSGGYLVRGSTTRLVCLFVCVLIASDAISKASSHISSKAQYMISIKVSQMLLERCSELSLADYENSEIYDTIERLTQESSYRPYQILISCIGLVSSIALLVSSLVYIFHWNPRVGLLYALIPPISLVSYLRIGLSEFKLQWSRAGEEREMWYITHIMTHDSSFREIKQNNLASYLLDKYAEIREGFLRQDMRLLWRKTGNGALFDGILLSINVLVLAFCIGRIFAGAMQIGTLVAVLRISNLIQTSSEECVQDMYALYSSGLFMDRLFEFLARSDDSPRSMEDSTGQRLSATDTAARVEVIELRNAGFRYAAPSTFELQAINLAICRGEPIAFVGRNGSGKSTVMKLISGLYEPGEGSITMDGVDLRDMPCGSLADKVSFLFQDFTRYELPIRENIGFGDVKRIDDDCALYDAIREMHLDFLVGESGTCDLNQRLGSWFEDGKQLSGGQWQKVGLARAFFQEADIYILDEPSAALDPVSERQMVDRFLELSKDRIAILISHSVAAIQRIPHIVVMENGRIVGEGNHETLTRTCAAYRDILEAERHE